MDKELRALLKVTAHSLVCSTSTAYKFRDILRDRERKADSTSEVKQINLMLDQCETEIELFKYIKEVINAKLEKEKTDGK